jgi:hypothetical protein
MCSRRASAVSADVLSAGHCNHFSQKLTRLCPCDLRSYEALFTANKSEPSVSPDDPKTLNKAASLTM